MRVARNILATDKPVALGFPNLKGLVFVEGEKAGEQGETLDARTRTNNQLNPHMTPDSGI